ncbi:MAG TPA: hypothetical protein VN739_09920 [Nitrososphaerales archaeon]|nr:hypothetical protein [Nitrososphaerales archaeon]
MVETSSVEHSISKLNLFLTGGGLFFFMIGSYMSLAFSSQSGLLYPGQYFFVFGIILSFIGIISIFLKTDF